MKTSKKRSTIKSQKLLARAEAVFPRASQTLSKAPDQFVRGVSPYAITKGKGCHVWDVDGNEYIDLGSSLGAIVLGYQHPVTDRAAALQHKRGTIFTLPGDIEVLLAEEIKRMVPFIESVRFGLNGSDVTSAAIRVARAYTGRDHVAKCGYHGWADWSIGTHPLRSKGVPQAVKDLTHEFSYNKIETLEKIFADHGSNIAAVILEPVAAVLPQDGFLEKVKALAEKHGAVLIFDELVTGFRMAKGGAAEYFGVTPDLVTYGKAISNGEPLSVLAGKKKIMDVLSEQDAFFSMTYAGYLPGIAAAIANLKFMRTHNVQKKLWQTGELLLSRYNMLAKKHGIPTEGVGIAPHPMFVFKDATGADDLVLKSLFIQETAKQGVLTSTSNMMNYSHEKRDIEEVAKRFDKVFAIMAKAIKEGRVLESLEGPPVRPRNKPTN
jgi:glutamate-1-semialdehyde aminotransferase